MSDLDIEGRCDATANHFRKAIDLASISSVSSPNIFK